MANKDQKINYKAFIPIGVIFIGAGITFMIAVNSMIGVGLIGVGVAFVIIGARKSMK
jgi:hypothetical protein